MTTSKENENEEIKGTTLGAKKVGAYIANRIKKSMGSFEGESNMAVYMLMIKYLEDADKVVYDFGPNESQLGRIEYSKKDKKLRIHKDVNDSNISNDSYVKWASQRIGQILYRENRVFPDKTSVER